MTRDEDLHSRIVAWLKIVLPLTALAILSTLFLVSDRRGGDVALPYSEGELDRIVEDQRIRNPNYSGVSKNGTAITLAAEYAQPDAADPQLMQAHHLIGAVETPGGGRLDLSADQGVIDEVAKSVTLTDRVALRSATGYRLETTMLRARLDGSELRSETTVSGTGPPGDLKAGGMHLVRTEDGHHLRFTDGVQLIYHPAKHQEPTDAAGEDE